MKDMFAVVIALLLFVVILTLLKRNNGRNKDFDERQALIRGRGYKYGFCALLLAQAAILCLLSFDVLPGDLVYFSLCAALALGLFVFCAYNIWHDAFFGLHQKPGTYLLICLAVMLANLLGPVTMLINGGSFRSLLAPSGCTNLLCACLFFLIALTILGKLLLDRKEPAK